MIPVRRRGLLPAAARAGETSEEASVTQAHRQAGEDGRTPIAVFDLDGTLLDGQSGTLVLRYLLGHGMLSKRAAGKAAWWGTRYKLHLPFRQEEVREIIFNELGSLGPGRIYDLMRAFHDEVMVPRYFAQGVEELRRHRAAGELTVIVSATFDAIAQAARGYLGADVALATIMERSADGATYTGRVQGAVTAGPEKARRLRAFADERFGAGNWRVTCAYGDHFTDAPLLEMAERPFAVNPGPTLRREAARRGWPQLEWK